MKSRSDEHLSRKFFHVAAGTLAAYAFLLIPARLTSSIIVLCAAVFLMGLDLIRMRVPAVNEFILRVYGPLMRDEEKHQPSAQLFYILGLCWACWFLPKVIAVQAILTLAWMDPVAGLVGIRYGKTPWNKVFKFFILKERQIPISLGAKTFEGSMAGFFAAMLAGIVAWSGRWASVQLPDTSIYWPTASHVLLMSVVGALAATIAEAWPSQWDDNAKIPFWTGLFVWVAALLMAIPLLY